MLVASCSDRSSALSSTGTATPRMPRRPLHRDAALTTRLAHDADRQDQLGSEGQRDGDHDARLVQHGRQGAQQPVGTGERVRRPEAEQDHGDLQTLDEGVEDRLQRDRTADAHGHRPRGQWHVRQVEEDVPGHAALAEEDLDHDPDRDDEYAQAQEEGDGA